MTAFCLRRGVSYKLKFPDLVETVFFVKMWEMKSEIVRWKPFIFTINIPVEYLSVLSVPWSLKNLQLMSFLSKFTRTSIYLTCNFYFLVNNLLVNKKGKWN